MGSSRQPVKAMVMAAGAGTRLRPLTFKLPKPMVPVANRPALEYTLRNLKKHGINDVVLNLHSHPQAIQDYFKDGKEWDLKITYSLERQLLGTAGGVKKMASFFEDGTFLVMSGDGLTDVDLTTLLEFHREKRSLATMALKSVDSRFDYGVTVTDDRGAITRFFEKPSWKDVFSNQVNTGIYVFEPAVLAEIPAGTTYDFGNQLWPKLLKARAPIFAQAIDAYWCDVGNLSEYRRAHRDILDGHIKLALPGKRVRPNIWVDPSTRIEPGVKIEPPCLIGKNGRIATGSRIGPYTVIGNDAKIGKNVTLRNCILWDRVRVADNAGLDHCVIANDTQIASRIAVYDGALVSASKE
jgi:mannose-1-phosphate guanylyltransferase / phosphomannomutase